MPKHPRSITEERPGVVRIARPRLEEVRTCANGLPDNRAVHRAALTRDQQALVESAEAWLWQEVKRVPPWLNRWLGGAAEQEAWLAVCKAAHDFDPAKFPGVPFAAYARFGVRKHLMGLWDRTRVRLHVWVAPPQDRDGEQFLEPTDHRPLEVDPRLKVWMAEENVRQRRALNWRYRLFLCLRYVESWTLEEVADFFEITRERVRQLEGKAIEIMARARDRARVARQLACVEE